RRSGFRFKFQESAANAADLLENNSPECCKLSGPFIIMVDCTMKPKISSYKELLEHQGQLKALLEVKKDLMRSDVELLKIETKPVSDLFGDLSDSERKRRLLAIGVAFAAKTVLQKIILRK